MEKLHESVVYNLLIVNKLVNGSNVLKSIIYVCVYWIECDMIIGIGNEDI